MKIFILFFIYSSYLFGFTPEEEKKFEEMIRQKREEENRPVGMHPEERTQVTSYSDRFYQKVGVLKIPGGLCEATFISANHLLTNGHCVAMLRSRDVYRAPEREMVFMPGKLKADGKMDGYKIRHAYPHPKWLDRSLNDEQRAAYDVAILEIEGESKVGFAQIEMVPDLSYLSDCVMTLPTYPGDKEVFTLWDQMMKVSQWIDPKSSLVAHSASVTPGTSGAPMRVEQENGEWTIVGVNRGGNYFFSTGIGVLFTPEIYNWAQEVLNKPIDKSFDLFRALGF